MPKTTFAFLSLLTPLLCFCLSVLPTYAQNTPAQAQNTPTRENQILLKIDYTPLYLGVVAGSGQPLVQVRINDTQTAMFLVDTGSTGTIVSMELAKQMNLPLRPALDGEGKPALWKGKQAQMTNASVLKVGSVTFNNVPLFVLDAKDFVLSYHRKDATSYQGILGINMLEESAILLDGQKHELTFCAPGNLYQHQVELLGFTQPYVLPLTHVNDLLWTITAEFTNGTLKGQQGLVVDTGSDSTRLPGFFAQEIGLKVQTLQGTATTHGVEVTANSTADELRLGELTLRDHPITIEPSDDPLPPAIGMDILFGYRVLIDFPGSKMYLQPNTSAVPKITIGPQAGPKP